MELNQYSCGCKRSLFCPKIGQTLKFFHRSPRVLKIDKRFQAVSYSKLQTKKISEQQRKENLQQNKSSSSKKVQEKGKQQDEQNWQKLDDKNDRNDKPEWAQHFQVPNVAPKVKPQKKVGFFSKKSFKDIQVEEQLISGLKKMGIERPSHIQQLAIDLFESGKKQILIADHAGSGKTLAYLLPIVKSLKMEEEALGTENCLLPNKPRAVVVCPTTELAAQVMRVARALSKFVAFSSAAITGGHKRRSQIEYLRQGVDLIVCTPGRLVELIDSKHVDLTFCQAVVLDEVDVLWRDEEDFRQKVLRIKSAVEMDSTRFLFVTATIPQDVWSDLLFEFPKLQAALGPGLHRLTPGAQEFLIDCSGGEEISLESGINRKLEALKQIFLKTDYSRIIVFCNKIENCRKVENLLNRTMNQDDQFWVLPYHNAVKDEIRKNNLITFLAPPKKINNNNNNNKIKKMVLVCTDRASRGLDSAYVDHVVLFDYPRDPSEYVRRVGRTARGAQGHGKVSILVLGKQVQLAQEMIQRNSKGVPIHKLPSNYNGQYQ